MHYPEKVNNFVIEPKFAYSRGGRLFKGGARLTFLCLGWALIVEGALTGGGHLLEALQYFHIHLNSDAFCVSKNEKL